MISWEAVVAAGLELRNVALATSYGRPALKVRNKVIACEGKEAGHFLLMLDLERVAFLTEMEPELFFQTPHYVGWPAVLVRYATLARQDLPALLAEAWARRVPKAWVTAARGTGT
jgi:hypothetical protein